MVQGLRPVVAAVAHGFAGDPTFAADAARLAALRASIESAFRGKPDVVELVLVAALARGHVLFEDVPGVGKTTLARAFARSLDGVYKRIQFTSDMLPADILGTSVFDRDRNTFEFRPGPIFANVLLADEINRATPRTQSALLEAMSEARVTVDNTTHALPHPFLVMATQNPKEHHGTYPLPESQLDRFLMRVHIGYPELRTEEVIVRSYGHHDFVDDLQPVVTIADLVAMQARIEAVRVDQALVDYLMRIVELTRTNPRLDLGVSTRGAIYLFKAAQARAYLLGRDYCIPDDVKRLVAPVFSHRVWVRNALDRGGEQREQAAAILAEIVDTVPVPQ